MLCDPMLMTAVVFKGSVQGKSGPLKIKVAK